MMADPELCGRVAHRQPFTVLLGRQIAVDAIDSAYRPDTVRRPRLALSGWHSHAIERGGDVLIGPAAGHAVHDGTGLLGRAAAMLPGSRLPDTQLRVLAALPVDDKNDLTDLLVNVSNDLGD